MKIVVLGSTGMLGRYIASYFGPYSICINKDYIDAASISYPSLLYKMRRFYFLDEKIIVVNCMGVIKPRTNKVGPFNTVKVNSIFPHILSDVCQNYGYKLIHITTDCVFDGRTGKYVEGSVHNAEDLYGLSKSAGEPENCSVIRTSIIGEEIGQSRSLIEWAKKQKEQYVDGFVNHEWNGVTCLQLAKIIEIMITHDYFWKGIRHIFSPDTVNKYELLQMISVIYGLNLKVRGYVTEKDCYRDLSTIYNKLKFYIPCIHKQIEEMKKFELK